MSGLYALFLLLLWLGFLVWLCPRATAGRVRPAFEDLATVGMFLLLLPLPLADEIVGAVQMNRLCEANAHYRLGVADPAGRTTRSAADPSNEQLKRTAIEILHTRVIYTDLETGERVLEYDDYVASGGLFRRVFFGGEMSMSPFVGRSHCSPTQARGQSPHQTYKFNVIN